MKTIDELKSRKTFLFILDLLLGVLINALLLILRNDADSNNLLPKLLLILVCVFVSRLLFGNYRQVWRYATAREFLFTVIADFTGGLAYLLISRISLFSAFRIPFWQAMAIIAVSCLASLSMRFCYQCCYRWFKLKKNSDSYAQSEARCKNETEGSAADSGKHTADSGVKIPVAIVGAGSAGFYLARELVINSKSRYTPGCFIDNDREKIGNIITGCKVYSDDGAAEKLRSLNITDVIIALPGLTGAKRQELFDYYAKAGFRVKIYELPFIEGSDTGTSFGAEYDRSKKPVLRDIKIEDLLFREPIRINSAKTAEYYKGKVILITGGGGSIGSEICRQLAKFEPRLLVIFDIYENNAYDIQQELRVRYGSKLNVAVEISSVREARRVNEVMSQYKPDIVVHAAAHKHVPLMEHNCAEAVKNNVFGTLNVAAAAEKCGVGKFIMISTDKAVNPTNIMGATKRMCEMIVQSRKDRSGVSCEAGQRVTEFTAVRFGNVLGSNGSVIPLFRRQIANGGPVTITDKRIIRYFMTIPEAAQLVLESGSMAKDGELFVLDMGKPVKILKLAEDMIRLSGFVPYKDIEIREIGLREGEKLYEELLVRSEELDKTDNDMIFVERDKGLTRAAVDGKLAILRKAVETGTPEAVKSAMQTVVPTYRDPSEVNQKAAQAEEMKAVAAVSIAG